jgi:hypothetical protein
VPRDDGIRGADWCVVVYNRVTGWVSTAGLMPGYMPPTASAPVPVPAGMDLQSSPRDPRMAYAAPTPPTVKVGSFAFKCTPPLDRSDRNPVKNIWVSFAFDETSMKMLGMSVHHERWNGQMVNRFDQYADAGINYDQGIYGWKGSWVKDRNHIMAGGAFADGNGQWFYRERSWTNSVPDYDLTVPCVVTEAE